MNTKLLSMLFFSFLFTFAMVSCEGDQGPIGLTGENGPQGPQGPEGPEGAGFQDCAACHQSQKIAAKTFQWENSVHATGGHYERNTATCAGCHTSQGFLEVVATGNQNPVATIEDPLPQNCYTCHQIHSTFTDGDWALTQSDPVTLWEGGQTLDFGKGNLCISCHQPRVVSPPLPDPSTGGTVNITSSRYGPHHGPQGVMLPGVGGYEVAGSEPYTNSAHTALLANNTEHACIGCHMATAQGTASGGHTFKVVDDDGDLNYAACVRCHTDNNMLDDLVLDRQSQIDTLMSQLLDVLVAQGVATSSGRSVPGEFVGHQAGAFYNYKYVEEDQSLGVHNFKYAKALLINSREAIE
jgi:hypothetical protein